MSKDHARTDSTSSVESAGLLSPPRESASKGRRKSSADGRVRVSGRASEESLHTFFQEEVDAFAMHINTVLEDVPEVRHLLPIEAGGLDLFHKVKDGILLCALIRSIDPSAVDFSKVNLPKKKDVALNQFQSNENQLVFLGAAKAAGLVVVNIRPTELTRGEEHIYLILGLLWQVIKASMANRIAMLLPQMMKHRGSSVDMDSAFGKSFLEDGKSEKETQDSLLLKWMNMNLRACGEKEITNLHSELADGRAYLAVLRQAFKLDKPEDEKFADDSEKVKKVVEIAKSVGVRNVIDPEAILSGNQKLNLLFVESIFEAANADKVERMKAAAAARKAEEEKKAAEDAKKKEMEKLRKQRQSKDFLVDSSRGSGSGLALGLGDEDPSKLGRQSDDADFLVSSSRDKSGLAAGIAEEDPSKLGKEGDDKDFLLNKSGDGTGLAAGSEDDEASKLSKQKEDADFLLNSGADKGGLASGAGDDESSKLGKQKDDADFLLNSGAESSGVAAGAADDDASKLGKQKDDADFLLNPAKDGSGLTAAEQVEEDADRKKSAMDKKDDDKDFLLAAGGADKAKVAFADYEEEKPVEVVVNPEDEEEEEDDDDDDETSRRKDDNWDNRPLGWVSYPFWMRAGVAGTAYSGPNFLRKSRPSAL